MNKKWHRWFNTTVSGVVMAGLILASSFGYDKYIELDSKETYSTEMVQITEDESFRRCAYNDSLGYRTIGFGHLVKPTEEFGQCINMSEAFDMLNKDYYGAVSEVEHNYPWAEGEVKLVLINMTYQLGTTRLAKFEGTLDALKQEDYRLAALEMLDSIWAKQTPNRAMRLAVRILSLQEI